MKKTITALFIATSLMMGVASPNANAGDVKLSGSMTHEFNLGKTPLNGQRYLPVNFGTSFEMNFQYIASENLSGTVTIGSLGGIQHRYHGPWGWGSKFLSAPDETGVSSFKVPHAYIDWHVPNTKISVRMGLMPWAPVNWCNGPMLLAFDNYAGIMVNVPFNSAMSATVAWFRTGEGKSSGVAYYGYHGRNMFYGQLNYNANGITIQPYALYEHMGAENTLGRKAVSRWNIGIGGQIVAFSPLVIQFNTAYGRQNNDDFAGNKWLAFFAGKHGFGLKANVGYKTPYGVPTLDVWYYSGDKRSEALREGHLPHAGGSNKVAMIHSNNTIFRSDDLGNPRVTGTWGLAFSWKNISFVKGLSHTATVSYWRGTNNVRQNNLERVIPSDVPARFAYMTTKDSYIEFDLATWYQIYPQLRFGLELAYGWANYKATAVNPAEIKNHWHIGGGFQYKF